MTKSMVNLDHGLINFIDTKIKCRHLKKLTCKGTLWQVFIRVFRLEIQSVMLVFSYFDLLSISTIPPSLCQSAVLYYTGMALVKPGLVWLWM
jgi:hypothetical protein